MKREYGIYNKSIEKTNNKRIVQNEMIQNIAKYYKQPSNVTCLLGGDPLYLVNLLMKYISYNNSFIIGWEYNKKTWEILKDNLRKAIRDFDIIFPGDQKILSFTNGNNIKTRFKYGDIFDSQINNFEDIDICKSFKSYINNRIKIQDRKQYYELIEERLIEQKKLSGVKTLMGTTPYRNSGGKEFMFDILKKFLKILDHKLISIDYIKLDKWGSPLYFGRGIPLENEKAIFKRCKKGIPPQYIKVHTPVYKKITPNAPNVYFQVYSYSDTTGMVSYSMTYDF